VLINVTVNLAKGQTLAYAPDAAAMQVLVALGGNATVDTCILTLVASPEPGQAGKPPPPTELP
jgi:hypothetical protein